MTALTDPISGLSYGWTLGEDNWNTGMDSNLVQLGATINITVLDFELTTVFNNASRKMYVGGSGYSASQFSGSIDDFRALDYM